MSDADMYILFAGSKYYPLGGYKDLKHSGSLKNCRRTFKQLVRDEPDEYDWAHIVRKGKIVLYGEHVEDGKIFWNADEDELDGQVDRYYDRKRSKAFGKKADMAALEKFIAEHGYP